MPGSAGASTRDQGRLAADWFRTATSPTNARATLREASAVDVSTLLAAVRCPAVVLHRRGANVISLPLSEELAAGLPGGRLQLIEGDSASLFFQHTDETVGEIVAFVTGAEGDPQAPRRRSVATTRHGLSPREVEVLRLLASGESNGGIAHRLGVSIHTVERHVTNLYGKIDARGRADATAFAIRQGLA